MYNSKSSGRLVKFSSWSHLKKQKSQSSTQCNALVSLLQGQFSKYSCTYYAKITLKRKCKRMKRGISMTISRRKIS